MATKPELEGKDEKNCETTRRRIYSSFGDEKHVSWQTSFRLDVVSDEEMETEDYFLLPVHISIILLSSISLEKHNFVFFRLTCSLRLYFCYFYITYELKWIAILLFRLQLEGKVTVEKKSGRYWMEMSCENISRKIMLTTLSLNIWLVERRLLPHEASRMVVSTLI